MNKIINKTQKKTSKSYKDYLGARIFEGDYVYYRGIFNGLFGYTFQEGVYRVRKITKKDGKFIVLANKKGSTEIHPIDPKSSVKYFIE